MEHVPALVQVDDGRPAGRRPGRRLRRRRARATAPAECAAKAAANFPARSGRKFGGTRSAAAPAAGSFAACQRRKQRDHVAGRHLSARGCGGRGSDPGEDIADGLAQLRLLAEQLFDARELLGGIAQIGEGAFAEGAGGGSVAGETAAAECRHPDAAQRLGILGELPQLGLGAARNVHAHAHGRSSFCGERFDSEPGDHRRGEDIPVSGRPQTKGSIRSVMLSRRL